MPSRAILTEAQTIPNADIVQALGNLKITATSGITTTLPTTSSTLAGLSVANTFTANQAFSGTINIVATTSTAGQITQAGSRLIHTFTPSAQNQNVFIGFEAGRTSTMTGGGNVGIGRACLQGLTSGANNLCFGDGVGFGITSGGSNVIIGQASGNTLSTGNNNTAVGVNSLKSGNTTGCLAVGYNALRDTLSNSHVAVGFNAGYSITGTAGNNGYNTCIGDSAGTATAFVGPIQGATMTTGTNNTMLGAKTSMTSASGTYRTAVGSDSICQNNNAIKLGRDTLDVVILPSMTTAVRDAYATPAGGSLIFNSTTSKLNFYNGTAWEAVTSA